MGRKKRSRVVSDADAESDCGSGWCAHGGRCARARGGRVCACAGAWGGARCSLYVGHDHACAARTCTPPALCVWGPDVSATEAGEVYCACEAGTACSPPAAAVGGGSPAAWIATLLVLLSLAAIAGVAALFCVHRRRQGAFVHARLADNVEISNPMYLAGEDDLDHHPHTNGAGGNHFANPVYESMYAPTQNNPPEEHATLLSTSEGSPAQAPAERAALL